MKNCIFFVSLLFIGLTSSCGLDKLGGKTVSNILDTLSTPRNQARLDSTIANLMGTVATSLQDSILSDSTKAKIVGMLDAVTMSLDSSVNKIFRSLREDQIDSLLISVHDFLIHSSKDLVAELLNPQNSAFVKNLIHDILNNVTSDVYHLRDNLLGPVTQRKIDSLVEHTMKQFDESYNKHLKDDIDGVFNDVDHTVDKVNQDLETLKGKVLWGIVGASAIIIALALLARIIYSKHLKSRQLVKVMARNIHNIPDQRVYDNLTSHINSVAMNTGLKGYLDQIIDEELKPEKEVWKDKNKQLLDLLTGELSDHSGAKEALSLDSVKRKAEQLNLSEHLESLLRKKK
jgi:hypothetical protein